MAEPNGDPANLQQLRADIDRIDNALHDLLMERAAVVRRIAQVKGGGPIFRPGREASVIRRLVARHAGPLPVRALVSVWREVIGAFTAVQGRNAVAVLAPDSGSPYAALARDHFGASLPLLPCRSVGQVMNAVMAGEAAVGVLPVPREEDPDPWWRTITGTGKDTPRIVGRLPFAGGEAHGDRTEAALVAKLQPEPTGDDATYLALEVSATVSRGRIVGKLQESGLAPEFFATWETRGSDFHLLLIEVGDFIAADDARLAKLSYQGSPFAWARPIGSYPRPLNLGP
ncbi:MAG: chorismate mutase [Alphaproteobacteria bacterium]|nr:chorismate mutase [Alphaproteobacteria bacterium]